jgi:ribosome-associated translation inhibitor RaiA
VFSKEAHLIRAEVSVHIGRGIVVNASASAAEIHAAYDAAAERSRSRCVDTNVACATTTRRRARPPK